MNSMFKVRKVIGVAVLAMMPVLVMADQEVIFTPMVDNLIMENGSDAQTANTVYPYSENSVGVVTSLMGGFWSFVDSSSLIAFNLSPIADKTVVSAYLYLYPILLAVPGATAWTKYKVSAIDKVWNTFTVTWNNQPTTFISYAKQFEVPVTSAVPVVLEVTNIVKSWMSGAWIDYGFMVEDLYHNGPYDISYYATSFGALGGDSSKVPKLVVTIVEDTPVPPPASKFMPGIINILLLD